MADSDQGVETIVVTGLRASLQRDLDIKRESTGLIDAITSEDIGKFPDVNLADAMMRIPGVTVTRGVSSSTSTGATTSTGEATAITVRGFGPSFNTTLFDGRQVPSAIGNTQGSQDGDRAFDFSSVNSDFVSQIDVLKSPDATLSSGAIGATINVKFPKPFDHPGLVLAGSVSGTVSPDRGKATPNGDVLFSDTFANDTIGVLAAASYSDTATRQNHINIQAWNGFVTGPGAGQIHDAQYAGTPPPDGTRNFLIQDYGIYHELSDVERMQGRLALQWRPTDALEITLNDNFSRDHNSQSQYGFSVWFNQGNLQNIKINANGTATSYDQPGTPTDFQGQINGEVLQHNDAGANVKWTVNDKFTVTLDADHAEGWLNPGHQLGEIDADVGYGGPWSSDLGIVVPANHGLPYPTTFGPAGDESKFINNGIIGSHVLPIMTNVNLDTINQAKVLGDWNEENLDLQFGFQYLAEHKNESQYDTFENNNWQAYSGYGPASGSAAGVALPQNLFTKSFSTAGFINGWTGASNLPSAILAFNPYTVLNYLQGLHGAGANDCCDPNGSGDIGRPFNGIYQLAFNPGSFHQLSETTYSGFVNATFKTEVAHMPLRINVGSRYEITDESVTGIGRVPLSPGGFVVQSGDPTAYNVNYGPSGNVVGTHSYQYLLPNLDFDLAVTDDLDVRFDASRTLTRPPISNLSPTYAIGASRVGNVTANGGNPDLLPFLSDNVDLTAQWYYQPNSFLSADAFVKSVSNFIVQGSTQQVFTGAGPGNSDIPYTLTTTINGPAANVYGLELSVQHVFDDTGFGFQVNGTLVGTDKPYDPHNPIGGFAVTGLSDSANFVGFYDKDGFQARIAVNWQDSYLNGFGQLQNGSNFGTEPTFVNTNWNADFSTSYDVTEQFTIYFEAMNLTDATYSTHGRFSEQVLDVVDYGRKFIGGVHFKL